MNAREPRPDNCPECGAHKGWGCKFDCPIHLPPDGGLETYGIWADEQKRQYGYRSMLGKTPPDRRQR